MAHWDYPIWQALPPSLSDCFLSKSPLWRPRLVAWCGERSPFCLPWLCKNFLTLRPFLLHSIAQCSLSPIQLRRWIVLALWFGYFYKITASLNSCPSDVLIIIYMAKVQKWPHDAFLPCSPPTANVVIFPSRFLSQLRRARLGIMRERRKYRHFFRVVKPRASRVHHVWLCWFLRPFLLAHQYRACRIDFYCLFHSRIANRSFHSIIVWMNCVVTRNRFRNSVDFCNEKKKLSWEECDRATTGIFKRQGSLGQLRHVHPE